MNRCRPAIVCAVFGGILVSAAIGYADDATKCEAAKLKLASKYGACRLKAESLAVKKAGMPDYTKCDAKFGPKWAKTEIKAGGMCPSNGDQAAMQSFITQHADDVAAALAGGPLPDCGPPECPGDLESCQTDLTTCSDDLTTCSGDLTTCAANLSACQVTLPPLATGQTNSDGPGSDGDLQNGAHQTFTDNGDGTITDNTTGLMWEKKSDDGNIHDKDNGYLWCKDVSPMDFVCDNGTNAMDGPLVTTFLAALNGGPGFAGYKDWRIPNLNELESIRNAENVNPSTYTEFNTGCVPGCTVLMCSCTGSNAYWSSTTYRNNPIAAYGLLITDGRVDVYGKTTIPYYVRAVRGGS